MRIDNNQQNLTFKACILVRGTTNRNAAKKLATPIIRQANGRRGQGFLTDGNSVIVLDKATAEGNEAQNAYIRMRRSFTSGNKNYIEKCKRIFQSRLKAATATAEPMDFPAQQVGVS